MAIEDLHHPGFELHVLLVDRIDDPWEPTIP
jgi:hypothetical protein